jgi:hypothetical protein
LADSVSNLSALGRRLARGEDDVPALGVHRVHRLPGRLRLELVDPAAGRGDALPLALGEELLLERLVVLHRHGDDHRRVFAGQFAEVADGQEHPPVRVDALQVAAVECFLHRFVQLLPDLLRQRRIDSL